MSMIKDHRKLKDWVCVFGGIMLYTLAMDLFLVGNDIAAGGLSGIAVALRNYLPFSVAAIMMALNVPILLIALIMNGWRYTIGAIIGSMVYSAMVQALSSLPTITQNPLVAAVFGGALYGGGMALIGMGNGSTGGTDLVERLLVKKFPRISLGKMALCVDGSIVIFAMVAFQNIEVGLYAIITICVCSYVADRIMLGFDRGCLCMIITSEDPKKISSALMQKMRRSVTKVAGVGMYMVTERSVLLVAVKPQEAPLVKEVLSIEDPGAFVMILPANEVLGGSFRTLSMGGKKI